MIDAQGRQIDYLRISITDRCNLRCVYCMPEQGVECYSHKDMLTYEEITRIVRVISKLGFRHLRITGGEPMARKNCLGLIGQLHTIEGIESISMTTNAILLDGLVEKAKEAGLTAVNISIDSPDPEQFSAMTRGGDVARVMRVIDDALAAGIRVKLNAVPVRGMNDDKLTELAAMAKDRPIDVRFIELMPIGCGKGLTPISSEEVLDMMRERFGELHEDEEKHGYGPARYVKPEGFTGSIGVISPISHEFCDNCNRVRLTAEGFLKLCLNHTSGLDLRTLIRGGASDDELLEALRQSIVCKPTRHGFKENVEDEESRRMNEIGG